MGGSYFLTINAGSSSIKFALIDADTLTEAYTGVLSGIGFQQSEFIIHQGFQEVFRSVTVIADHASAARLLTDWLEQHVSEVHISAVGHRIVHGGQNFSASRLLDEATVAELQTVVTLDPEHLPHQLALVSVLTQELPNAQQIACFDTALFHDLPLTARMLPLPRALMERGVRRYGFHGLSYTFVLEEFAHIAGQTAAQGKVIIAHLGNGASVAAFMNGKPVDTSMGMTPAGGLPMSTRSGDIDPGVITYLARTNDLTIDQLDHLIGFESGLLGVSETSGDMKTLLSQEDVDHRAKEAVDIFCYQTRKYIGAYAAALGGLNSLIFTGGIGEVSAIIRRKICADLGFLGIELNEAKNSADAECISIDGSSVGVHVIATNEAQTMARDMQQLVHKDRDE